MIAGVIHIAPIRADYWLHAAPYFLTVAERRPFLLFGGVAGAAKPLELIVKMPRRQSDATCCIALPSWHVYFA
jgi:hypothetical protein